MHNPCMLLWIYNCNYKDCFISETTVATTLRSHTSVSDGGKVKPVNRITTQFWQLQSLQLPVLSRSAIVVLSSNFLCQNSPELFLSEQPRIRKLSRPDVSCWSWDQGHHRRHHFCFLPRFTTVDWEGWSTSHSHLRQTRWFQFPHHKLSLPE